MVLKGENLRENQFEANFRMTRESFEKLHGILGIPFRFVF